MAEETKTEDGATLYWRMVRAFDLLRALHQTFYDQVKTADQQAGFICTFLTILFAYSKEQGNVLLFLNQPPSWTASWIISVIFAGAASFSLICTFMVILPRTTGTAPSSFFWGAWTKSGITLERLLQ